MSSKNRRYIYEKKKALAEHERLPKKELYKKVEQKKVEKPKKNIKVKKKKKLIFRFLHVIFSSINNMLLVILLISFIGTILVSNYLLGIINDTEPIDPLSIKDGLIENTIIVDSSGEIIETLYGDRGMRTNIEYEDIGQNMIDAIIAIEDKTFFEHNGFNYIRLAGAFIESVSSGEGAKGTSSITQQLAKNMYLTNERALERKIKEAYYAIFLERTLSKEQIIEAYLNKIALGMQANGVESASRIYFSKEAKDLNLVESAIIAGIPKAPSKYAPMNRLTKEQITDEHIIIDESNEVYTLVFNTTSQQRYNTVIQQMYNNDMITKEEYDFTYGIDISKHIHPNVDKTNTITSYFGDMVKEEASKALALKEGISEEEAEFMLYNRGYIIHSTIDFDRQQKLEAIYDLVDLSDKFDEITYNAVKKLQGNYGLDVDGVVGEQTLETLAVETSFTLDDFTQNSYYWGMVHEEVTKLKMALDELGMLSNDALYPKVVAMFNDDKNIINDETEAILLFKFDNLINEEGQLIIRKGEYYYDEDDNLVLLKNKSLNFYQQPDRVQVVVKQLFNYDETSEVDRYIDEKHFTSISGLYIYEGRDVLINDAYKTKVDGNLVISRDFFIEYPDFFIEAENKDLLIDDKNYIINKRGEIQPQSAFVLMDHNTGQIKAVVGGRKSYGQNIYNRALVPHQPGSSIKPIGVYSVAINSRKWTAASVIDDVPTYLNKDTPGERWPINWYEESAFKYRGRNNLRRGIEDSLNVVTAKLANRIGVDNIVTHLKKLGVSTIVETDRRDVNISALALGGMTYGISPIELTAAYATYGNKGVYIKPISFTKITDLSGNIIIDNEAKRSTVLEEQVAFIIQDMMRTSVTRGYARKAQIREGNEGIPVAGKTGTTSDKRDALFIGYTPYYTAAVWFGNDVRLKMDEGSGAAAEFWQIVMAKMHEDLEDKSFIEPEGIERAVVDRVSGKIPSRLSLLDPAGPQLYTEIFLPGTVPTEFDDAHVEVKICLDSGRLPTANCPNTDIVVRRVRVGGYGYSIAIADQRYMAPGSTCDIPEHQGAGGSSKVIETSLEGIVSFIRDYNLLLKNGDFKYIPTGSVISSSDYTITLPSGERVLGSSYNIRYVTNPATQQQAIEDSKPETEDTDTE